MRGGSWDSSADVEGFDNPGPPPAARHTLLVDMRERDRMNTVNVVASFSSRSRSVRLCGTESGG